MRDRVLWVAVASVAALCTLQAARVGLGTVAWMRAGAEGIPRVEQLPQRVGLIAMGGECVDEVGPHRRLVGLAELPPHVVNAFVVAEDDAYWMHPGVDPTAVARAAWRNLRAGAVVEGGSTITQQVVKQLAVGSERSLRRKGTEAALAVALDGLRSKEEVLELYLNWIYLGNGAEGVEEGARHWFGKPAAELTLAEAALLAAMVPAPVAHADDLDEGLAKQRRDRLLGRMREKGTAGVEEALSTPIQLAPSWLDRPIVDVGRAYRTHARHGAGAASSAVLLGMDVALQAAAEAAVREGIGSVRGRHPSQEVQAAVVVIDNETGAVRALVGGRDEALEDFDRATQARRQPSSTFKAVVYAAALEAGFHPLDTVDDSPLQVPSGDGTDWVPRNANDLYLGPLTLRAALAVSSNVASVRLTQAVGIPQVQEVARRLGIVSPIVDDDYTIALGSSGVSLLELTGAYAAIARGGEYIQPHFVRDEPVVRRRALAAGVAAELRDMLKAVVNEGTAREAHQLGQARMGKTGTSNGGRDAWFVGATPELTIGVWVGRDDDQPMWESGASAALPIFQAVVAAVPIGASSFVLPADVERTPLPGGGVAVVRKRPASNRVQVD